MFREVRVKCVIDEPVTGRYFCILETMDSRFLVPINLCESGAEAIYIELCKIVPPRPMTFDFISSILSAIDDLVLEKVIIYDVENCIFKAKIIISHNGVENEIECRPSDAIALSLRMNCPIYMAEKLIQNDKCICKEKLGLNGSKVVEKLFSEQKGFSTA
jgi:bifunctional DNase/RNase